MTNKNTKPFKTKKPRQNRGFQFKKNNYLEAISTNSS